MPRSQAGTKLQIAVYGGSALMLASNFRFATEDVDVSELDASSARLAGDASCTKSPRKITGRTTGSTTGSRFISVRLPISAADHLEFGTFPRDGEPAGLVVSVPSAEYLLALKLKAFRIMDPLRGETERFDILNLMRVVGISTAEEAIALLGRYFPISAASSEKQQFLLKNMNRDGSGRCAQIPSLRRLKGLQAGSPRDVVLAEFVDTFDLAKTDRGSLCVDRARAEIDRRRAA